MKLAAKAAPVFSVGAAAGAQPQPMDLENGGARRSVSFSEGSKGRTSRATAALKRVTVFRTLLVSSFLVLSVMLYQSSPGQLSISLARSTVRPTETLVTYVYSNTDPEYEANLIYFLTKGVSANDGCEYVIIIQEGEGVAETHSLPDTPPNVRFVRHANECFDWGTFGWALDNKLVDPSKYKYFILINSSVRGPFLPPYWPSHVHWSDALTSRINSDVKLVGSTISCEGSWKGGVLTGEKRQNPHVQSYVLAMDQVALRLVQEDPTVLKCYNKYHDAVWYAEMGSSAAILRAGYNIDSLMMRYQGIDWRQTENWGCNAALNPYAEHMYDGIDLSPFEIMFVKLKEFLLEANWTTATQGYKYSQWNMQQVNVRDNEYTRQKDWLRLIKILGMRYRGSACFDFDLYRQRNPDLPKWGPKGLWEHFVKHGQHEGRVFRFRCPENFNPDDPVVAAGGMEAALAAMAPKAKSPPPPAAAVAETTAAPVSTGGGQAADAAGGSGGAAASGVASATVEAVPAAAGTAVGTGAVETAAVQQAEQLPAQQAAAAAQALQLLEAERAQQAAGQQAQPQGAAQVEPAGAAGAGQAAQQPAADQAAAQVAPSAAASAQ